MGRSAVSLALMLAASGTLALHTPPVPLPYAGSTRRVRLAHPLRCSASGEEGRAAWRCARVAVHREARRGVSTVRTAAYKAAVFVLALMVCMPFLPAYTLALSTTELPPYEVTTPAGPRYFDQAGSPVVQEMGIPSLSIRMPGLDSTPVGGVRRKTSFVTAAVQAVGPAVVRIDTERLVDRPALEGYLVPGLGPEGQRRESGQGSGVILSEDGLIMTNAHVVKNAAKVTVTLIDGRTFEGVVKGSDDFMDLAAIRITPSGKPLPTAPLGRSGELQVGDWAIAIGNAVGLDSTVTLGIISSLSRSAAEVGIPNKKVNFIQTDAAINPGNSGGPLVNEFGEVIGINTAIRANAAGIGFAIPIDTAEKAMKVLSTGKKISHAYLGISMLSLTPAAARLNNDDPNSNVYLPEQYGALVLAVGPDTPAARAGFRKFDLITEIGGTAIKSAADAQELVDKAKVGVNLQVKVLRQQKQFTLDVVTGDLSDRVDGRK
mmetsp:Transcript_18277/g.55149  ORF Transcript_18277/g.55149 Transcript_18277/m.55149 type:complete len:489 (-) Transcript_18277:406-1872(-)